MFGNLDVLISSMVLLLAVKFLDFSPNSIGATVSLTGKSICGTSSASAIKFALLYLFFFYGQIC